MPAMSEELLLFSLNGVITVTLAPACAAASRALVTLLERSHALIQITLPCGMIVEKKVDATLSSEPSCPDAIAWPHAVSTNVAPVVAVAVGLGEGVGKAPVPV